MRNYLLLLLIPLIFAIYSFALKNADGPNYNYGLADPSYVYLLNSLTLSNLEGTGHTDHPGVPLQIAGAVIVKVYFFLSHEKDNITEDVIYRPEAYLRVFDHSIIILNAIGLFLAGFMIFYVFKNIFAGMIFQTIPFVSINLLEVFSLVKTENFAFFLMLLQIILIIKYVYDPASLNKRYYLYVSGLLCGLIMAVKISFLCIIFLPLIVFPGYGRKLAFLLLILIAFFISVLPILSNMGYFIGWISKLIIHNGRYGSGEATVIKSNDFFRNILKIANNEKFFTFTYFLLFAANIFLIFKKKISIDDVSSKEKSFCISVFIAMSVHILMVAKHYSSRYMFPALLLSVPALFISASIFYRIYFSKFGIKFLYAGMLSFLLLFGFYIGRKQLAKSNNMNSKCIKLTEFLNADYKDDPVIYSPGVTSEKAALIFAYYYTPHDSRTELKKYINLRFPGILWYDVFNERLVSFSEQTGTNILSDVSKSVLYRSTDENYNEGFIKSYEKLYNLKNIKLTQIFSNDNGELIFRIEN